MTFTSKRKQITYVTDEPTPEPAPKALTRHAFEDWLRRMPPLIEGMPTQREYGEWLPRQKQWLAEAATLAQ